MFLSAAYKWRNNRLTWKQYVLGYVCLHLQIWTILIPAVAKKQLDSGQLSRLQVEDK